MDDYHHHVVVIPTLNPEWQLVTLVGSLRDAGFCHVLVVDDGSENTAADTIFAAVVAQGAVVLHHPVNLGKGSALKTAMVRVPALFPETHAIITVDGDGQHLPDDVVAVCKRSLEAPDSVVLGVRDVLSKQAPARSRFGNAFSALFFSIDTGVSCPDTQTGLRCIPRSLFSEALSTPGARYDFEMNFLTSMAKQGVSLQMVPIATVYHNNNAASHFRAVRDSLLIYKQFLRYTSVSLVSAATDLGLFAVFAAVLPLPIAALVAVATALARISSGVLNFALNRSFSFQAKRGSVPLQATRYGLLFVAQMLLSMLFVTLLSTAPLPLVAVKVVVDSALFFVSYFVQRNWVFASSNANASLQALAKRTSRSSERRQHVFN